MREMLTPTSAIAGMDLDGDVALITDGRFSGGSKGASIGHISPRPCREVFLPLLKKMIRLKLIFRENPLNS